MSAIEQDKVTANQTALQPGEAVADAGIRLRVAKSLLRFNTCGSVDDGKSTLIGRLLYDSKALFDDQLATLEADSKKVGTRQGEMDYALLLDGLSAEREQGITIDVSYRFFSTETRNFIVADTPGHEQYTRNMVTGASTADLSIILIDARKGILTQTRRHSVLVSLLGIRHVVLVVNKMDLVDYSKDVFAKIESEYRAFAALQARPANVHRRADLQLSRLDEDVHGGAQHHGQPFAAHVVEQVPDLLHCLRHCTAVEARAMGCPPLVRGADHQAHRLSIDCEPDLLSPGSQKPPRIHAVELGLFDQGRKDPSLLLS